MKKIKYKLYERCFDESRRSNFFEQYWSEHSDLLFPELKTIEYEVSKQINQNQKYNLTLKDYKFEIVNV